MSWRFRRLLAALVVSALGGCAPSLPTYPWVDAPQALAAMAVRADSVRTVASSCTIFVKRWDGYSVSLDGAVAARIPGWLRVRAWKFGTAVLDATVTPEGIWLVRSEGETTTNGPGPGMGPQRLAEAWGLFTGAFFSDPGARVVDGGGARFIVERPLGAESGTAVCEVDRQTLTARSFVITDPQGVTRLSLRLERYRLIDRTPWPMRMILELPRPVGPSASQEPARLTIRFDELEINPELPAGAFVPPRRAVRQP